MMNKDNKIPIMVSDWDPVCRTPSLFTSDIHAIRKFQDSVALCCIMEGMARKMYYEEIKLKTGNQRQWTKYNK